MDLDRCARHPGPFRRVSRVDRRAPPIASAVVKYSEVDHARIDGEVLELAERWLSLDIRRDLQHGGHPS
jgi:hypothetical protein